jgi:trans-2-enoyl-CoA reductase
VECAVAFGLLADAVGISFNFLDTERMRNVHESINEVHFQFFGHIVTMCKLADGCSIPVEFPRTARII